MTIFSFLAVSLFAVGSANASAQASQGTSMAKVLKPMKPAKPAKVKTQGDVTSNKARAIALKKAPGKVESEERETEKGMQVYSFDIRNKKGTITEVWVNVKSGKVVHRSTKPAEDEAKEKFKDAKEKNEPIERSSIYRNREGE